MSPQSQARGKQSCPGLMPSDRAPKRRRWGSWWTQRREGRTEPRGRAVATSLMIPPLLVSFSFLSHFSVSLLVFPGNQLPTKNTQALVPGYAPRASALRVCAHEVLQALPATRSPAHCTPAGLASWLLLEYSKHASTQGLLFLSFAHVYGHPLHHHPSKQNKSREGSDSVLFLPHPQ